MNFKFGLILMELKVSLIVFPLFFFLFISFLYSRLDVYIYDYLVKRNLQNTAKAFMTEGKVAADPVGNGGASLLASPCLMYQEFVYFH